MFFITSIFEFHIIVVRIVNFWVFLNDYGPIFFLIKDLAIRSYSLISAEKCFLIILVFISRVRSTPVFPHLLLELFIKVELGISVVRVPTPPAVPFKCIDQCEYEFEGYQRGHKEGKAIKEGEVFVNDSYVLAVGETYSDSAKQSISDQPKIEEVSSEYLIVLFEFFLSLYIDSHSLHTLCCGSVAPRNIMEVAHCINLHDIDKCRHHKQIAHQS